MREPKFKDFKMKTENNKLVLVTQKDTYGNIEEKFFLEISEGWFLYLQDNTTSPILKRLSIQRKTETKRNYERISYNFVDIEFIRSHYGKITYSYLK